MTELLSSRRATSSILVMTGALFLLYPVVRPYSDEASLAGAQAMASTEWIAAHLFAMAGFILLVPGLLGVHRVLAAAGSTPPAFVGLTGLGVALVLPYYGAEIFGLNAIAQRVVRDGDPGLLVLADTVRMNTAALTMFLAGLLLLGIGTVLAAVATWRSGHLLPRWAGVPLAVGFATFLPQFFGPPWLRIGHGLLIAVGCVLVAIVVWRSPHPVIDRPRRGSAARAGAGH